MRIEIGKDENAWVNAAWTWIHEEVMPGQRVFIPAGGTPQLLYRRWTVEPTSLLRSLSLMQLDEILSGPMRGEFKKFLQTELPDYEDQIEWIDGADKVADVSILGVGINGHVAFHEPGLPKSFGGGCVRLSEETMGYLGLKEPTWGVTYGVATFLKSKKILVLARGEKKRSIIQRALKSKDLPISWILEHPAVTLITDFAV